MRINCDRSWNTKNRGRVVETQDTQQLHMYKKILLIWEQEVLWSVRRAMLTDNGFPLSVQTPRREHECVFIPVSLSSCITPPVSAGHISLLCLLSGRELNLLSATGSSAPSWTAAFHTFRPGTRFGSCSVQGFTTGVIPWSRSDQTQLEDNWMDLMCNIYNIQNLLCI